MRISRRLGIVLAILLFVGFAGFFDVYDYLKFNFLIKRMDSQLNVLSVLDRNVMQKKAYINVLNDVMQPQASEKDLQNITADLGLSLEKIEGGDMAYKVTGTCLPSDFKRIVAWLMHHGNFRIDSLSVQNSVKTAVSVPSMMTVPRISIDMIVVGVMGR